MILITEGQTKKVYFTLQPTIPNPYFIFKFTSNDTGTDTLISSPNLSTFPHFQSFTFSEGSGVSASGGFDLIPGTYDYEVWESQFPVIDLASASNVLEIGLMTIKPSATGSNFIWKASQKTDYVYYEPLQPVPPGLTGS